MARIEISIDEYNGLKERINRLENESVEKDKTIELLKYNNGQYKDIIEYVFDDITPMERIFQWKHIKRAVNETLVKVKEK